jgi:DNA-binding cell septation regulator SpoVG
MFTISRFNKFEGKGIKAFADVIYDGKILIKGIKLIEHNNERFIKMPNEKGKDNKWHPIVLIQDKNLKDELQQMIIEKYNK